MSGLPGSLPFDEWHDLVDRVTEIILDKLGHYLKAGNAHDLAEIDAAIAIVDTFTRQEPEP